MGSVLPFRGSLRAPYDCRIRKLADSIPEAHTIHHNKRTTSNLMIFLTSSQFS